MKTFTVLGLLAADFGRVQRHLRGRAELRLVDHERFGKKRVNYLIVGAGRIIVNTRFVSHAATSCLDSSRCTFVCGGASVVQRAIEAQL